MIRPRLVCFFFFFNDTATTEIYTLSLHDALPISIFGPGLIWGKGLSRGHETDTDLPKSDRPGVGNKAIDRKSTRLNSSHLVISYAVFCLKKKKEKMQC